MTGATRSHRTAGRSVQYLPAAAALAAWIAWSALVEHGALTVLDGRIAREFATHSTALLDRLAAPGAALFGLAGTVLLTLCVLALLLYRRYDRAGAVALVLGLALAAVGERSTRAVLTQPTPMSVRSAAFSRAQTAQPANTSLAPRVAVPGIGRPQPSHSYPSGHASLAGALAAGVALACRGRPRLVALLLAVLAAYGCWSELYRGSHLFSDAAGGLLLGASTAAIAAAVVRFVTRRYRRRWSAVPQ